MRAKATVVVLAVLLGQVSAQASDITQDSILIDGQVFSSWSEYVQSDYFMLNGKRCGTPPPDESSPFQPPSDCANSTNPTPPEYAPGVVWEIPVVVHIIMNAAGTQGVIPDQQVFNQITVLNEDFRAIPGTPGELGTDVTVQFALATVDPNGDPTTGITRSNNDTWFNDGGAYWTTLAWDPRRYLNIYTNSASGNLGYVPFLPHTGGGSVGTAIDRVVILWSAFGRPGPIGPPYNLGRSATHEVGHYLGLYHTFQGACGIGTPPDCYSTGDRICDTAGESTAHFGCPIGLNTCAGDIGPDPIHNYMSYTDDSCYQEVTPEQARRNRCTLIHYRPLVYRVLEVESVRDNTVPSAGNLLSLSRPNPFNPTTEVVLDMVKAGPVSLVVMDVNGRAVRTLASGSLPSGSHRFTWDGTDQDNVSLASGVYFYQLETEQGSQTQRMVLVR